MDIEEMKGILGALILRNYKPHARSLSLESEALGIKNF